MAAPFAASILADAGAEVIKFETERRPDNLRGNWPMLDGMAGPERSFYWHLVNRNKLELTLDLTTPQGKATFLELASISDAVVENFAAGTMDRLGVPYEVLRRANPGLVMVSLSGFGATGPARSYVGYGPLIEAVTGFAYLGGYEGGPPAHSAFVYTDYVSAIWAANLVLAGLMQRAATGQGTYYDVAQTEIALNAIPDAVLDAAVNGSMPRKRETRDEFVPVHGTYPCKTVPSKDSGLASLGPPRDQGKDEWLALAARTEEEWQALRHVLGDPAWAHLAEFSGPAQRAAHQAQLDARIAEVTRREDARDLARRLRECGVPATKVYTIQNAMEDPNLRHREAFQQSPHPVIGVRPAYSSPAHIEGVPRGIRRPAPLWGQHNHYVTRELLGLDEAAVQRLTEAKALR